MVSPSVTVYVVVDGDRVTYSGPSIMNIDIVLLYRSKQCEILYVVFKNVSTINYATVYLRLKIPSRIITIYTILLFYYSFNAHVPLCILFVTVR